MTEYILTVDIGGSKYMIALLDSHGSLVEVSYHKWRTLSKASVIEETITSTRELLGKHLDKSPSMIGITIPGLADPRRGIWLKSSFSGIGNLSIGSIFQEEFGIPVYIDNDAQACALAEKIFGACKDKENFLYMTISNGIGGAVFTNNMLYYGGYGHAGEIGHCIVVEDGYPCKCGNNGCLEMHAAGPGIVRTYLSLAGNSGPYDKSLDAKAIAELAKKGDATALKTFQLEGYYIGKVVATISNVLNPEIVVIGGGVSLSFSLFEESLNKTMDKYLFKSANPNLKIQASQFGYNGGIYGAAAVALSGKNQLYNWANLSLG